MFFLVYSASYIEFVILEALASKPRASRNPYSVPWLNNEVCGILGNIDHVTATDVLGITHVCLFVPHCSLLKSFRIQKSETERANSNLKLPCQSCHVN